ncbi:MAG: hypothetical protein DRG78_00375 [Epsilonproteobacteria bacterium]|nr:MAG: hypothetical protein DRG78_00375 [Campylobacterota bacterium]
MGYGIARPQIIQIKTELVDKLFGLIKNKEGLGTITIYKKQAHMLNSMDNSLKYVSESLFEGLDFKPFTKDSGVIYSIMLIEQTDEVLKELILRLS